MYNIFSVKKQTNKERNTKTKNKNKNKTKQNVLLSFSNYSLPNKYQNMFYHTSVIIHTFIAVLFSRKSSTSLFTNSINHNRAIMFHQNPCTQHCPVANESDHSQSNFHTDSGFTNILIFYHSRPFMNTCNNYSFYKLLSVSDG